MATFAISPLIINADTATLYSKNPVSFSDKFNDLLSNGQLMYYSLGFVASAAWILLMNIRRPRLMMIFIFGGILYGIVRIATSIGVDPQARNLNIEAFRDASYSVFFLTLFLFLVCNLLAAWQEQLRPAFSDDADKFAKNYKHPED